MRTKHLPLTALVLLTGCSLIWSPSATVKKFMAAMEKGDVDTMTQLFSSKAVQKLGADTIRANNQSFVDTAKRVAAGGTYHMEDVEETAIPEGKQVSFFYKNDKGPGSIKLVFVLSKENGTWKIDSLGAPESELKAEVPATTVPMLTEEPPPPPPPGGNDQPETKTVPAGKSISGGVLNGKAISLPKPPYPPVARAAKASGTVVVQVLIDENGNVVEAHAISGHPLLKAACVAAARTAKFSPTKLSGQPVKVSGVINYSFEPPQ